MANFFVTFENSMLAAAFAEAGEHETAKTYLTLNKNAHKRILFGTNARDITPTALGRVIGICKRIGAALEILHVLPPAAGTCRSGKKTKSLSLTELAGHEDQLKAAGIFYRFVVGSNSFEEEILQYVAGRRDVLMVVLGLDNDETGPEGGDQTESRLIERLKCPLVLLAGPRSA